jgi:hypothetical protein
MNNEQLIIGLCGDGEVLGCFFSFEKKTPFELKYSLNSQNSFSNAIKEKR